MTRTAFPAFAVTVDVVILTLRDGMLQVLLVERGEEPFRGSMGGPGRLQAPHRDPRRGRGTRARGGDRRRGRRPPPPVRGLWRSRARPAHERRHGRLSRGAARPTRTGRLARMRRLRRSCPCPRSSAGAGSWRSTTRSSSRDAIDRVRLELEVSGLATAFVGDTFTLAELRSVYEAVWGVRLDAANFRRSVADDGWVVPTGRRTSPGPSGGRPAELYRAGIAWRTGGPIHRERRSQP